MTIQKDYAKSMRRRTTFEQRIWDKSGVLLETSWGTHWELDGILFHCSIIMLLFQQQFPFPKK
jgi:hypothetical protein